MELGGRGRPALFQSTGHRNKRRGGGGGWEAQVPDGERGIDPQRGFSRGVCAGLSKLIKMKEK